MLCVCAPLDTYRALALEAEGSVDHMTLGRFASHVL